jgi:hypothetical protein
VTGPLVARIDALLTEAGVSIAHLKIFVSSGAGYVKASVCRNGERPFVDGSLDAPLATRHALVLNLRAAGAPEVLGELVARAIQELPGQVWVEHQQAFRPPAPVPEHRFEEVV